MMSELGRGGGEKAPEVLSKNLDYLMSGYAYMFSNTSCGRETAPSSKWRSFSYQSPLVAKRWVSLIALSPLPRSMCGISPQLLAFSVAEPRLCPWAGKCQLSLGSGWRGFTQHAVSLSSESPLSVWREKMGTKSTVQGQETKVFCSRLENHAIMLRVHSGIFNVLQCLPTDPFKCYINGLPPNFWLMSQNLFFFWIKFGIPFCSCIQKGFIFVILKTCIIDVKRCKTSLSKPWSDVQKSSGSR